MAGVSLLQRRRERRERRGAFEIIGIVARGLEASTYHELEIDHLFDGIMTYDGRQRLVRILWNARERKFDVIVSGGCRTHRFHLTSPTLVVRMIAEIDLLECHPSNVARSVQRLVTKYNRLPDNGNAVLSHINNLTLCFYDTKHS